MVIWRPIWLQPLQPLEPPLGAPCGMCTAPQRPPPPPPGLEPQWVGTLLSDGLVEATGHLPLLGLHITPSSPYLAWHWPPVEEIERNYVADLGWLVLTS